MKNSIWNRATKKRYSQPTQQQQQQQQQNINNDKSKKRRHPPSIYVMLWEKWTQYNNESSIVEVDWNKVLQKVQSKPQQTTTYRDDERNQMVLLHIVCALDPPINVVEAILQANPQAIYYKSTTGITPLMVACGRNVSLQVLRLLLSNQQPQQQGSRDNGNSINDHRFIPKNNNNNDNHTNNKSQYKFDIMVEQDSNQFTPLHWACRHDVSDKLVKQLLMIYPKQVTRYNLNTFLQILSNNDFHKNNDNQTWNKICYLLWAAHYKTIVARSGQAFSTIHATLALLPQHQQHHQNTASLVWKLILDTSIELYGHVMAGVQDEKGLYPLHYACRITKTNTIPTLLKHFPLAAQIKHPQTKNFPLLEAVKNGLDWYQDGVQELYELYSAAISQPDTETGLYPCFLAKSLDTAYNLLVRYPQVVFQTGI